jgi:hypothetical protein
MKHRSGFNEIGIYRISNVAGCDISSLFTMGNNAGITSGGKKNFG